MNAFECGQYKYMTNIEKGGWKKSYVTKWFQEDQICHFFMYFMSAEITAISLSDWFFMAV